MFHKSKELSDLTQSGTKFEKDYGNTQVASSISIVRTISKLFIADTIISTSIR